MSWVGQIYRFHSRILWARIKIASLRRVVVILNVRRSASWGRWQRSRRVRPRVNSQAINKNPRASSYLIVNSSRSLLWWSMVFRITIKRMLELSRPSVAASALSTRQQQWQREVSSSCLLLPLRCLHPQPRVTLKASVFSLLIWATQTASLVQRQTSISRIWSSSREKRICLVRWYG